MIAYKEKIKIIDGKVNLVLPPELNNKEAEVIVLIPDPLEIMDSISVPLVAKKNSEMPTIKSKGQDLSDIIIEDRR